MTPQHQDHDHGDDDAHAEISESGRPGYYEVMETAVRELLIEKHLIGSDEIRRQIELLEGTGQTRDVVPRVRRRQAVK